MTIFITFILLAVYLIVTVALLEWVSEKIESVFLLYCLFGFLTLVFSLIINNLTH